MSKWFVVKAQTVKYVLVEVSDQDEGPEDTAMADAQTEAMADECEIHAGPLDADALERWQRHCDMDLPLPEGAA